MLKVESDVRKLRTADRVDERVEAELRRRDTTRRTQKGGRYSLIELAFAAIVGASSVATTLHLFLS